MTKSIQQVKQDLVNLKSIVADTAHELESLYHDYLDLLNQSLKQQLILACYQICTQLYPKSFLDLSLSEKQELQQNLRQLGLQLEPELATITEQKILKPDPPIDLNLMAELIKNLPKPKRRQEDESEETENKAEISLELVKAEIENMELIEIESATEEFEDGDTDLEEPEPEEPIRESIDFENPEHLVLWHKQMERDIKQVLDATSRKVNKYLQQSKIIPNRIPNKVIDVAMQTESSKGMRNHHKQPNLPHVLNLAIESDKKKKTKSATAAVQISLLRLRLVELEFSDHQLNAARGKIRNLLGRIKTLNSQYQDIKQEESIIEAQAAWRSSWYED